MKIDPGLILIIFVVAATVGSAVGAVFLKAAIALCNLVVERRGLSDLVPQPDFGHAMAMIFVIWLVDLMTGIVVGFWSGLVGTATGIEPKTTFLWAQAIGLPAGILTMSALLMAMLAIRLVRAFQVTIWFVVVSVAVAGISFNIFKLVGMVTGRTDLPLWW